MRPKLSAGRVQSVAVRLIVERERQRMAFVSATYWDLLGTFAKSDGQQFEAELVSVDGRKIPAGKDFDPATGKLKDAGLLLLDEQQAARLGRAAGARPSSAWPTLEDKPYTSKPYPPFTTSTLQQEANRKLGFTARRTMQVAQSLYENGHITYMRTDSTNLAKRGHRGGPRAGRFAVRQRVSCPTSRGSIKPRSRTPRKPTKRFARPAIRSRFPKQLRGELNADEFRLYDLIWKRTIASQMADARGRRITITVEGDGAVFQAGGKTIDFPGYLRAYVEGSDDPEAELAEHETVLPQRHGRRDARLPRAGIQEPHHAAARRGSAKPR